MWVPLAQRRVQQNFATASQARTIAFYESRGMRPPRRLSLPVPPRPRAQFEEYFDDPRYELINLEIAYEKMPGWNIIDAFANAAKLPSAMIKKRLHIFPSDADFDFAVRQLGKLKPGTRIVVAPGPGVWPGRNWDENRWHTLCLHLLAQKHNVIIVGTGKEYSLPCSLDLRDETTPHQLAAVVARSSLFVGIDSFPAHVAGAVHCPRVVLFGITSARLILCDAPNTIPVESDPAHPYTGARHHVERISSVRLGNPPDNPMKTIGVDRVITAINNLI